MAGSYQRQKIIRHADLIHELIKTDNSNLCGNHHHCHNHGKKTDDAASSCMQ